MLVIKQQAYKWLVELIRVPEDDTRYVRLFRARSTRETSEHEPVRSFGQCIRGPNHAVRVATCHADTRKRFEVP